MNHKVFHYYPVNIKNSYSGKGVKGFKFSANGTAYDETSDADRENLQQMQIYFGVNSLIACYSKRFDENRHRYKLKKDYHTQCIAVLTLASSMCWVVSNPGSAEFLINLLPIKHCMKLNQR